MRKDNAKGTRIGPTKRSRNQSETKNRGRCIRGTPFNYVESHQITRFIGGNHACGVPTEEVKRDSSNICTASDHNINGPMAALHDRNECRSGPLSEARGRCGGRHLNSRSFPRSAALIVAALVMVLPTFAPFAEAKKTLLKPMPENVISYLHSQPSQQWKNPVVQSLVNFVRPSKKRTKTKVVNISELGAAQDSVEPSVQQQSEVSAPEREQVNVVEPEKKKKVLLLPLQSAEATVQEERQEGLMGQTEGNDAETASQSGYADDTPGIFLPLTAKESPAKLRQGQTEEFPKEGRLLVTNNEAQEERKLVIKELHKYQMSEGESASTADATTGEADEETVVYYYLPEAKETGPGDHPLPEKPRTVPDVVYDGDGNAVPLSKLHDAGDEVHIEHPAVVPAEKDKQSDTTSEIESSNAASAASTSDNSSSERKMNAVSGHNDDMPQAQDQMIIISTVATMALLVGALSARRLRSRQFLSSCIENESLEDDVAYDAAYTHSATPGGTMTGGGFRQHPQLHHRIRGGSGAGLMGGSPGTGLMVDGAVGYDTFASPGGNQPPPWKGDLEKFDV